MKKYFLMHLKSSLEYKVSFILTMIAQVLSIVAAVFVLFALFNKFGILKDFSLNECMLALSIIHFGYYYAEFIFRGFDQFHKIIKRGKFDLLLIKPENIYIQILGSEMEPTKVSRLLATLAMLIYSIIVNKISLSLTNIIVLIGTIIGSIMTFGSLIIIGAAICFYTIEGLEIINIFTCGSRQLGEYPMGIYKKKKKKIFTYVIPLSCLNYYPVLYILGRTNNLLFALSPLFTVVIILFSILFFNFSLKHYQSSGS